MALSTMSARTCAPPIDPNISESSMSRPSLGGDHLDLLGGGGQSELTTLELVPRVVGVLVVGAEDGTHPLGRVEALLERARRGSTVNG